MEIRELSIKEVEAVSGACNVPIRRVDGGHYSFDCDAGRWIYHSYTAE